MTIDAACRMLSPGQGDVVLKAARHPCLEEQPDIQFIANDHEMYKGELIVLRAGRL